MQSFACCPEAQHLENSNISIKAGGRTERLRTPADPRPVRTSGPWRFLAVSLMCGELQDYQQDLHLVAKG